MSGLAECFQKPHFQQAHSTSCLWHKKKGEIEAPSERLGTKPLIPHRACQRGAAGGTRGGTQSLGIPHSSPAQRQRAPAHSGGAAQVCSCAPLTENTDFSPEERANGGDGLRTEKIQTQGPRLCARRPCQRAEAPCSSLRRRAS